MVFKVVTVFKVFKVFMVQFLSAVMVSPVAMMAR